MTSSRQAGARLDRQCPLPPNRRLCRLLAMSSYPVQLFVYDLSGGMARQWAPLLLGRPVRGALRCVLQFSVLASAAATLGSRCFCCLLLHTASTANLPARPLRIFLCHARRVTPQAKATCLAAIAELPAARPCRLGHCCLHQTILLHLPSPSPRRQIEAIYHTGVVVHGRELYFGGGINVSRPGATPFGRPLQARLALCRRRCQRG